MKWPRVTPTYRTENARKIETAARARGWRPVRLGVVSVSKTLRVARAGDHDDGRRVAPKGPSDEVQVMPAREEIPEDPLPFHESEVGFRPVEPALTRPLVQVRWIAVEGRMIGPLRP